MPALEWDGNGDRLYETGVKNVALFLYDAETKAYEDGVAWSGVTGVTESASGAEETALYADDIKYLSLYSPEELGLTIEAYTSPEEFDACDGSATLATGITIGQQPRKIFGLAYVNTIGNDLVGNEYGEKINLVYGCHAGVTERAHTTINESPEAMTCSWEVTTTPVAVEGHKNTSKVTIDSTKVDAAKYKILKDYIFGTTTAAAKLPDPAKILDLIK